MKHAMSNSTQRPIGKIGIALVLAFWGFAAQAQPSVAVGVNVQIRTASDFYEPLTSYGRWASVGAYGSCWFPGQVAAGWRPYCNGSWQYTDAGWFWASDEPWAWATYHYGRWNLSPQFGWYWVPQTQWAPAWVSWHSGGGYIGWAPMYPSGVNVISPQAYVFVNQGQFLNPIRPTTVIVNNTTIIKKTTVIQAPASASIEKASGRKVQSVSAQQLRGQAEATVATRQRTGASPAMGKAQTPVHNEAAPVATKVVATHTPVQAQKATVVTYAPETPAQKNSKAFNETHQNIPATATSTVAKSEVDRLAANRTSAAQAANRQAVKQEKQVQQISQPSKGNPAVNEKDGPGAAEQNHENKGKE